MSGQEPRSNPYPGLRPFEPHEAHLFFGRDEQIDELLRRLRGHRFLALVGTSGSGKSSLVRAGLLPALLGGFMVKAGAAWRVATMKPGADPIGNLANALNAPDVFGRADNADSDAFAEDIFTEVTLRRGPLGLVEATRHAAMAADENLLVLVDQFEELFRFSKLAAPDRADDPPRFVNLLLEAVRSAETPIHVVLTMRSEFLGECARFPGLAEAINAGQYLVPRLTRDQLREAIVGPAKVGGSDVTPRLLQQLLGDAGDEPNQLPVLQHALMRTWDLRLARGQTGPLDLPDYQATGGMSEALSRHVNDVYDGLPDDRSREIARTLFVRLTETRDGISIRRPTRLGEICDVAGAGDHDVIRVVEAFRRADRSFVTPADGALGRSSTLDIAHESLIGLWERLKAWRREEQESVEIYRRLSEGARLEREHCGSLWRGPALSIARRWRDEKRPTAAWAARYDPDFANAMRFLARSEVTERRARLFTGGLLAAIFLAMAVAVWQAWVARDLALEAELTARIRAASAVREPLLRALLMSDLGERALAAGQSLPLEELHDAATAPLPIAARGMSEAGLSGAGFTDADTVATVTDSGILAVWRADGRGAVHTIAFKEAAGGVSHAGPLKASMSADGRWVAGWNDAEAWLGPGNGSAAFRDAGNIVRKDNTSIDSLTFSRDGSHLAVGYVDGTARVWPFYSSGTTALGPMLAELNAGSAMTIPSLAFDPAGARLAVGSGDGVVSIWDVRTARLLTKLTGSAGAVRTVGFSPDGEWLIAGYENRIAMLWRADGNPHDSLTFAGHDAAVIAASISRDGLKILTASEDKALVWTLRATAPDDDAMRRAWEIVGGPRTLVHGGRLVAAAFSPDGRKAITGARDGTARVWWSESQEPRVLGVHGDRVESLAFSGDGTRVISASDDGTARIWAIDGGAAPVVLEGHQRGQWVRSAMFRPGTDRQVITASDDATVRLWTLSDSIRMKVVQLTDPVFGAAFDGRGGRVVTAVADNTAKLWDVGAFDLLDPLGDQTTAGTVVLGHDDWVMSAQFSPDGSRVVTASKDGTVRIWLLRPGGQQPEHQFAHRQTVYDAAFSPDGAQVVSSSEDGYARIWFLNGSQSPIGLKHDAAVNKAAFSDDGAMVVTASRDGTAVIWDAVHVSSRLTLRSGREAVRAARFTPAGTEVVTGSADGVVRLWRIDAKSLLDYLKTSTTACLDRRERMQFLGETGETAAGRVAECEARSERLAR